MPDEAISASGEASREQPRALPVRFVHGLLMGTADVIPGVSGGTMALILGFYPKLIDAVSEAAAGAGRLLRGDVAGLLQHLRAIDWLFVVPLGLGIVTALLVGAAFIPDLIDRYPEHMRALFFGLIAGSIIIPWRQIREHSWRTMALVLAGGVGAFLFTGLPDRDVSEPNLIVVFLAASVAICAMILPGVSGAFLLLVLGLYERTLDAVHDREVVYILTFMAGAAVGISLFSSALKWLLAHAQDLTMAVLVGLMAGSLRALWPYLEEDRGLRAPGDGDPVIGVIVLVLAGVIAVVTIELVSARMNRGRE